MKLLEQPMEKEAFPERSSTLSALDLPRQPRIKTASETCLSSIWFSSPEEVKCYCRLMHMISWSGKDSNLITMCDGKFLDSSKIGKVERNLEAIPKDTLTKGD